MITELFILFSGYFSPCFIPPEILPYCDLEDLRIFSERNPAGQRAFPRLLPGQTKGASVRRTHRSIAGQILHNHHSRILRAEDNTVQTADLRRVKDEIALCRVGSQRYLQAWRKLQLRSCILSAAAYKVKRTNHGLWILIPKVCIFRLI